MINFFGGNYHYITILAAALDQSKHLVDFSTCVFC